MTNKDWEELAAVCEIKSFYLNGHPTNYLVTGINGKSFTWNKFNDGRDEEAEFREWLRTANPTPKPK